MVCWCGAEWEYAGDCRDGEGGDGVDDFVEEFVKGVGFGYKRIVVGRWKARSIRGLDRKNTHRSVTALRDSLLYFQDTMKPP